MSLRALMCAAVLLALPSPALARVKHRPAKHHPAKHRPQPRAPHGAPAPKQPPVDNTADESRDEAPAQAAGQDQRGARSDHDSRSAVDQRSARGDRDARSAAGQRGVNDVRERGGATDPRGTGVSDVRGRGVSDARGSGGSDVRERGGATDPRGTGVSDVRGRGVSDARGSGGSDVREGGGGSDARGSGAAPSAEMGAGGAEVRSGDSGEAVEKLGVLRRAGRPGAPRVFSGSVDLSLGSRRFEGAEPNADNPAVPLLGFKLELYPFGYTRLRVLRDVSLVGEFSRSLSGDSVLEGGKQVSHTWQSFSTGVHARVRTGSGPHAPLVGIYTLYGGQDFTYEDRGLMVAATPSVSYRFIRQGLDLSLPLGRFAVRVAGAYRGVISGGYLNERLGGGTIHGLEVSAGASVWLGSGFELGLAAQYERYFYDGGAADEWVTGKLTAGWAI